LKNIRPAAMTVGGWFDAEDLFGTLATYRHIETGGHGSGNTLVMGPWIHGGWGGGDGESLGPVSFNAKTSLFFRETIEMPCFEFYLKGKGDLRLPKAWVFQTGTNQWLKFNAWPPKEARAIPFYLSAEGRLSSAPPAAVPPASGYDEYVSDPAKPVPYLNKIAIDVLPEFMAQDQRFAAVRPDVLVYQTEVLQEDLAVAGPIQAELFVATSGTDSDWIVKLIDVYPNDYPAPSPNPAAVCMGGYQQLVRGDVMRGKFRNSFEKPEAFVPNQPTAVRFTLPDVCHAFRTGHRLMIQVQSTWFPLVDRNPQTFVDIYTAKPSDFHKSTQRVYRAGNLASRVTVPALP
jgi:putative CocE/NonD family hydrolase